MDEIEQTLNSGVPSPAKGNRQAKSKIFPFKQTRLGKYYEQKRVEVIYVVEQETLITVTVYVFYGEWKD